MDQMDPTQYQHYIPQLILRRFAVAQPIAPSRNRKNEARQRKQSASNAKVKVVSLDKDPPEITDEPVRRTFGQQDMYNDDSKFDKKGRERIEKKLGEIEAAASRIIARVVDAYEAGKEGILLSRYDKDLLRKFQFVMKYRGPIFFRRFNHQTAEAYDSVDKTTFLGYMQRSGFSRPLDVSFDNLTKIIDMPIDPEGRWPWELAKRIYPPDGIWLIINVWEMHTAFVTPSDPDDEFILTENAFGIHEGPVSYSVDRRTGKQTQVAYTEFHLLTVISPRLVMVLRHDSMPEPLEDMDPNIRKQKLDRLAEQAQTHLDPEHATSLLQDFPLEKARLVLAQGEDGKPRPGDTFHFAFSRLESRQIQTINMVMLDQAHKIDKLVFKSEAALRKALEFYLDYPCLTNGMFSLKTISDKPDDPMLLLFQKLEHVARILGSGVRAKYHVDPLMEDDADMSFDEAVAHVLRTVTPVLPNNPFSLPMTVLMEVLEKMEMNIRATYAMDQILEADGRPWYPDLIYAAVQATDRKNLSQRTKDLLNVDRQTWLSLWYALVKRAMQEPGADPDADIIDMLEKLRQHSLGSSTEDLHGTERIAKHVLSTYARVHDSRPDPQPEFSARGLRKAFDDLGRDMERENSPSHTSSLINHPCPQSESKVIENTEESNLRYRSQTTETKSEVSLGNTPAVRPEVPHYEEYPATTPWVWKIATGPLVWKIAIFVVMIWLGWPVRVFLVVLSWLAWCVKVFLTVLFYLFLCMMVLVTAQSS
jgi:hypothetical protein